MIEKIYKNYEAFSTMIVSTAMLSNVSSEEFDADGGRIIEFIGKAYHLDDELIKECKRLILDELVTISIQDDAASYINSKSYDYEPEEFDALLQMKCDALAVIRNVADTKDNNLNPAWFDYEHYKPYFPMVRFEELSISVSTGNIAANRTLAIMQALGIGCEKDYKTAELRLGQCVLWADYPSIHLLAYLYQLDKKEKEAKLYEGLAETSYLIKEGRTLFPKELEEKYGLDVKQLFVMVASIKQDIIINAQRLNIDYSFVEVMMLPDLDFYKKLRYINEYHTQQWKEVTNPSTNPKGMGFRLKEAK